MSDEVSKSGEAERLLVPSRDAVREIWKSRDIEGARAILRDREVRDLLPQVSVDQLQRTVALGVEVTLGKSGLVKEIKEAPQGPFVQAPERTSGDLNVSLRSTALATTYPSRSLYRTSRMWDGTARRAIDPVAGRGVRGK